jgi:ubiquinone/menaquinone biosynthesis C-methylase UbiE
MIPEVFMYKDLHLEEIAPGVFISNTKDRQLKPKTYLLNNVMLHRFMDVFYVDTPKLEELDKEKVKALCRARLKHYDDIDFGDTNDIVRQVIEDFVIKSDANKVLEIGAGAHPIISNIDSRITYILSDVDQDVVEFHNGKGFPCVLFSELDALPYPDGYFDIMISAFVFHFCIYKSQIREMARCLNKGGAIVSNVYRRDEESRTLLKNKFSEEGLLVERVKDPKEKCKGNEYWIICKENRCINDFSGLMKSIVLG